MARDAYILWTERGLACRLDRFGDGWQVSVEAQRGSPFLRRFAPSRGDAANQAEYLRLLLDRSRGAVRKSRERPPTILIVDGDAGNVRACEEMLELEGFRTASASSLAEARRLVREVKPSAVLLDDVLPGREGHRLTRALRDSCIEAAIPILLVTRRDPAMVPAEYDGAPDAVLGKPCRPEALAGVLKLLVRKAAPGRRQTPPAIESAGPLVRACCPLCGLPGALMDQAGHFHCQQCGNEGHLDSSLYVNSQL